MGKLFNIYGLKSGGLHFEKFIFYFYHLKTLGWTCGVCAMGDLPPVHSDETEFIVFQHVLKFPEVPGNET